MAAEEISLKLLVHEKKNQVIYAESGYEFVDVLLSFLTMPIATVIRLTANQSQMGCLHNIYGSLEDLDLNYLLSGSCKNMLLHPKNAWGEQCRNLTVNIDDDLEPANYYLCEEPPIPRRSGTKHLVSTVSGETCYCGRPLSWKMPRRNLKKGAGNGRQVFVKGTMRYMITDELQISPVCMTATLELLQRFEINDATVLEERNVNLGSEEVLQLLKHSLCSKTPLTDMFLPVHCTIDRVSLDLKVMSLDSKDMAQSCEKEIGSDPNQTCLKLFVSKSRNKVLYAQVGEDFADMLFKYLTFPLSLVVKSLDGCTSLGCLDNLYKNVEELGNKDCMKSEEHKAFLLDPKLGPYFSSANLLTDRKEPPRQFTIFNCWNCAVNGTCITDDGPGTCSHGYQKIQFEFMNPEFCDVVTEVTELGAFFAGPATFMVTDELLVKPLSTISCLSLLNQFHLTISDLEEWFVSVGEEEALSLLKASLISKTVLSDVFLKKPKQLGRGSYKRTGAYSH